VVGGCSVFPNDNIWNTPIDTMPVDPASSSYITIIGRTTSVNATWGSSSRVGIPFVVVPTSQALVAITFTYNTESNPGPYPIPTNVPVEAGSDTHLLVLRSGDCKIFEVYAAVRQSNNTWKAGSGAIFDLKSNALRTAGWTSADAAGLPIIPGLVKYDEVASGEIKHAIRMTVPQTRNTYLWPARHFASSLTGAQYPPMGQRFRLRADFDISGFSSDTQVILTAMKRYGMIVADNGLSWYMIGAPDPRWNDSHLAEINAVKGSDLEAVDESSLMIDPNSGQAR
jgi:hypothetical protein